MEIRALGERIATEQDAEQAKSAGPRIQKAPTSEDGGRVFCVLQDSH